MDLEEDQPVKADLMEALNESLKDLNLREDRGAILTAPLYSTRPTC